MGLGPPSVASPFCLPGHLTPSLEVWMLVMVKTPKPPGQGYSLEVESLVRLQVELV